MSSRKPKSAPPVEEQQPAHGGSYVRQPDGTLDLIEQTVLTGPGEAPLGDGALDGENLGRQSGEVATPPAPPIDPDAAPVTEV